MVDNLYHISNIKNLESLLKYGLLSRQELVNRNIIFSDIANQEILLIRSRIFIKYKGMTRRLDDYVPLFFAPKRPMLYRLDPATRERIIYLEISTQIVQKEGTLFTDGIATTQNITISEEKVTIIISDDGITTERIYEPEIKNKEPLKYRKLTDFYIGIEHLDKIWMSTITKEGAPTSSEEKRLRQAEILILKNIPRVYLTKISVKNEACLNDCRCIMEKLSCKVPIVIKTEYFV